MDKKKLDRCCEPSRFSWTHWKPRAMERMNDKSSHPLTFAQKPPKSSHTSSLFLHAGNMAASLLSGAVFGASIVAAGIYQPAVIVAQLRFQEWHMVQVFMTAAAGTSIVYALFNHLSLAHFPPRSPSPLGFFPYDGNLVGGALLGVGMALSGGCPGTVLAQAATGVRSGVPALFGAIACGILWSGVIGPAMQRWRSTLPPAKTGLQQHNQGVYDALRIPRCAVLGAFVTTSVAVVSSTLTLAPGPQRHPLRAVEGGVAIVLAQLFSLAVRREMIGASGTYEDFGKAVLGVGTGAGRILFGAGVMAGAAALAHMVPEAGMVAGPPMNIEISTTAAVVGGGLAILGSRLAGGCPSGHGLSGIALMGISSYITVAAVFIGGSLTARLMMIL